MDPMIKRKLDELLAEAGMTREQVDNGATVQELIRKLEKVRNHSLDGDGYPMGYPPPATSSR